MDEFLLVAKNLGIKELGNNAEVEDSVVSAENYVFDDNNTQVMWGQIFIDIMLMEAITISAI